MSLPLITSVQFEAVRHYFLSRAYDLLNIDPEYKLYCHIPSKLVSFSYFETTHSGDFNIPQKGGNRVCVFFNEEGRQVPLPEPIPAVFAEIPFNSNSVKEVDVNLLTKMLVPPFMNF